MTEENTEEMIPKKKKEDSTPYCPICTPIESECKGRLTTLEWDNDDNEKNQEEFPKWSQLHWHPPHSSTNHIIHLILMEC